MSIMVQNLDILDDVRRFRLLLVDQRSELRAADSFGKDASGEPVKLLGRSADLRFRTGGMYQRIWSERRPAEISAGRRFCCFSQYLMILRFH